jgi:hypothetical protein
LEGEVNIIGLSFADTSSSSVVLRFFVADAMDEDPEMMFNLLCEFEKWLKVVRRLGRRDHFLKLKMWP